MSPRHDTGADHGGSESQASATADSTGRNLSRVSTDYDAPRAYYHLDEVYAPAPLQHPDEAPVPGSPRLEDEVRSLDLEAENVAAVAAAATGAAPDPADVEKAAHGPPPAVSRRATQVYTVSYLIFFSFLGTLARLGLQALTSRYVGAPVAFSSLWPNFAGSLVMGFLAEDRALFRHAWAAAAPQKTIPLYIGLTTGFCGSFTSFSSFVRDLFFALANDDLSSGLPSSTAPRNGGYSFMALLAVLLLTVSLSLSGLFLGAHLALALAPVLPPLPRFLLRRRRCLDVLTVGLAAGCWLAAVLLSVWPPSPTTWRGRAVFALVFAPLGCLARFCLALTLNGRFAAFPLGTFAANLLGTAVLGMAWDLAHAPAALAGGPLACQLLQGLQDGFCGCLTTVSTWVAELSSLRRRHAYVYGAASVLAALAALVAIMGSLRWTEGFAALACVH